MSNETPTCPRCSNCQSDLIGRFCHVCGQKVLSAKDRRFPYLVNLFFSEITSLDGRFWRTILGLLRPGFLSQQYLSGRRANYLSPVSVFLLINVLYFFAPALNDFDLPFADHLPGQLLVQMLDEPSMSAERRERLSQVPGQLHSRWSAAWIEDKLAQRREQNATYTLAQLGQRFDVKSAEISKLLIIVHVPFLALALWLMFRAKALFYAEHFVVALHLFAAILLSIQCVFSLLALLPLASGFAMVAFPALLLAYLAISLHRVYQRHWFYSFAAAFCLLAALLATNMVVYRSLQFAVVFYFS